MVQSFDFIQRSFNRSWVILTHLRVVLSFLCFQTNPKRKLFSFEYRSTIISIIPLGPAWACPRVWRFLLPPEVRLSWARGTSLEWGFWSFRLIQVLNDDRMNGTILERRNEKHFVLRSFLGNDSGTRICSRSAIILGRTRPTEWGRDEKSGSVFIGEFTTPTPVLLLHFCVCWSISPV